MEHAGFIQWALDKCFAKLSVYGALATKGLRVWSGFVLLRTRIPAQDAVEYFQYLLEVMSRAERAAGQRLAPPGALPTAAAFNFRIEDRVQCSESGAVSYKHTPANVLPLYIDLAAATNKEELEVYKARIELLILYMLLLSGELSDCCCCLFQQY